MAPLLNRCCLHREIDMDCIVRGDAKFLGMAISNFLSNAATHTPEGGIVSAVVTREGNGVRLTVENQGSPIPADQLERVWDSFYKVDEARVRNSQAHAGLGLAIVKNIVARHGGACRAENTAAGVAFTFSLPAVY